ncbi:hypothetical protein MASR2M15_15380 [Anaerolineales bacterium]
MKVILLKDIYKHGVAGQVVSVADGFARNYLIPRGDATLATPTELKKYDQLLEKVEARRSDYEDMLNNLGRKIDGTELIFGRLAASTGKLFGSVTTQEIADALMEATGVDINRRRVSQQPLREIGEYSVPVRLGNEISPMLKIIIVREAEMAEFMAARAAAAQAGEAELEADEAAVSEAAAVETVDEVIEVVEIEEEIVETVEVETDDAE